MQVLKNMNTTSKIITSCYSLSLPRFKSLLEDGIVGLEKDYGSRWANVTNEGIGLFRIHWETINQKTLQNMKSVHIRIKDLKNWIY